MSDYSWYFPPSKGGDEQGFEDSSMNWFKKDPHHYIARETIQNSLDARNEKSGKEPVFVEFRFFRADMKDAIPDLDGYKKTLQENLEAQSDNKVAQKFFKRALSICEQKTLNILSISDSNTVGIKDINKPKGRWHGLIKMVGKGAQEQRNMGGTFGIGKVTFFCLF